MRIGSRYQAVIPEVFSHQQIVDDLEECYQESHIVTASVSESQGSHTISDHSDGLHHPHKEVIPGDYLCIHKNEEKLLWHPLLHKSQSFSAVLPTFSKPMVPFDDQEKRKFQRAYFEFGKNFYLIQTQVETRSVRELVEYYYTIWKPQQKREDFSSVPSKIGPTEWVGHTGHPNTGEEESEQQEEKLSKPQLLPPDLLRMTLMQFQPPVQLHESRPNLAHPVKKDEPKSEQDRDFEPDPKRSKLF